MGTITVRKRRDGSTGYTAQIRIMQKGVTVYQESQAFDRKATAQAWIQRVETEMPASGKCLSTSCWSTKSSGRKDRARLAQSNR